jgi:hypothetical protein
MLSKLKVQSFFEINPLKALHENLVFWVATMLPLCVAFLVSIPLFGGLNFDFSTEGYKTFLEIFSFPLWILSASLIFGVLVNRFHSSAQKVATISQSKLQNNFSNYLSHRDHFQKYMQSVAEDFDLKVDAFKIYGIVFSKSTPSGVSVEISDGIFDYYQEQFELQFWSKMKFASPDFTVMEVNIYFPRFAKSVGINAEKIMLKDYEQLKEMLIKIRKLYRRAMEYGLTRLDASSNIEIEESGFAMLTGDFDLWANENKFKDEWPEI